MSTEQPTEPSAATAVGRTWPWFIVIVAAIFVCVTIALVIRFKTKKPAAIPLSPDDPVEQTYRTIFTSYGGQAALDRWKCGTLSYEVTTTLPNTPRLSGRITDTFSLPGRLRRQGDLVVDGHRVELLFAADGRQLWKKRDGSIEILPRRPYDEKFSPEFVQSYHPHSVLREGRNLSVKGVETDADGRRDLVLVRTEPGRGPVEIHVDVQSKLIRRVQGVIEAPFTAEMVNASVEFHDYRMTEGGPVPRLTQVTQSGRLVVNMQFLSVEFLEKVDPTEFEPPAQRP